MGHGVGRGCPVRGGGGKQFLLIQISSLHKDWALDNGLFFLVGASALKGSHKELKKNHRQSKVEHGEKERRIP